MAGFKLPVYIQKATDALLSHKPNRKLT